jgi:hypothetical protein
MALTQNARVLHDGTRNAVMQLTGSADGALGTPPPSIVVDASELRAERVKVSKVTYDVQGGSLRLAWVGQDGGEPFLNLSGQGCIDYCRIGGANNGAALATGDMTLTPVGFDAGSGYSVLLEMRKK